MYQLHIAVISPYAMLLSSKRLTIVTIHAISHERLIYQKTKPHHQEQVNYPYNITFIMHKLLIELTDTALSGGCRNYVMMCYSTTNVWSIMHEQHYLSTTPLFHWLFVNTQAIKTALCFCYGNIKYSKHSKTQDLHL